MADEHAPAIEDYLVEDRTFPPPADFKEHDASSPAPFLYDEADDDYEALLGPPGARAARLVEGLGHDLRVGAARSPSGSSAATLNVSLQLPRPPRRGRPRRQGRVPLGGRAGRHPHDHLRRAARRGAALRQRAQGPRRRSKGDRVAIYMPMIPELPVAMLACARIGAPHSVVFGGFSPDALADRINDAEAKVLITADGGWRRGRGRAAQGQRRRRAWPTRRRSSTSSSCSRTETDVAHGRRPRPLVPRAHGRRRRRRARPSRWTARTCSTCSTRRARRPSPRASCTRRAATSRRSRSPTSTCSTSIPTTDVYWCAADIGWVTGHSYIVYGPLANGATSVMYEGTPDTPGQGPVVGDHREATASRILYTAPTAIRTFMKWGDAEPEKHDLSSLRLLGSVGEPINPEAWMWYQQHIGGGRCPIVDTWWQTETGAIMISPLPGVTTLKPGSATFPLPGHRRRGRRRPGQAGRRRAAATSRSPARGRRCCAASTATPSATRRPTGAGSRAATSPATAPRSTTTATSGCSAGSTT